MFLKGILPGLAACHLVLARSTSLHHFKRETTNDTSQLVGRHFDYIIAGGGLTGLTAASRISEDLSVSVLVVEAGYDRHHDPRVYDVRAYGEAFNTELDYAFQSTPIPWRNGKTLNLVAGKMLGGSGSLNGASWTKGPKSQYDLLPALTGDESWSFENFNKYMLRAEHFNAPESSEVAKGALFLPSYHGIYGPVQVSFAQGMFETLQLEAINASQSQWYNLKVNADAASGIVNGVTTIPNMLDPDMTQNRSSPYTAYIKGRADGRPNLTILTGHRVTRINWNTASHRLRATGVQIQADSASTPFTVHADREVLLACGSMQSPALLELSGVGDPAVLEPLGINVVKSIPAVGRHFQEQTKNTVTFRTRSAAFHGSGPPSAIAFPNVHQVLGSALAEKLYHETLTTLGAHAQFLQGHGFIANATAYLPVLRSQVDNLFLQREAAVEIFYTVTPSTGTVGIDLWNLIVLSRGSIHVNSQNPFTQPVIEPAYFQHPLDLQLQTHATKQSRQVYGLDPLEQLVIGEVEPGLQRVPANARYQQWEDYVKNSFTSVWHPIATLAMMKEEFGGVVDSQLKVYGIENVRVIDASVLPVQLSAHLSSSLYGIVEKVVEDIRAVQWP